ncbi:MAG TPA: thiamine phosphate synthase [Tissierellaceae bacterium]
MNFKTTLYLVADSSNFTEDEFLNIVKDACLGGVDLIQHRNKDMSDYDFLKLSIKLKEITDEFNVPLIIDDRLDIAVILDCGVHLGQSDIPIKYARKLLKDNIIGATTKTKEQALLAEKEGADYLGVGAIFPTTTKVKTVITSLDTLNDICNSVDIPVMAIGGINIDNYDYLKNTKIDGICVVSAIMNSSNPKEYTEEFKEKIKLMISK